MAEFPAFTRSPARVHELARMRTGHHPVWVEHRYTGGLYSIGHFRVCSYCGCIHPGDMIDLLDRGQSKLESTAKAGKYLFTTPNPVAGDLVRMGSMPGRVFDRSREPTDLPHKLKDPTKRGLVFEPTITERLVGHFERPAFDVAPAMIVWPFYAEHATAHQWREIEAAADRP